MATDIQQVLKGLKYNRGTTKSSLTRFKTYVDSIDETNFNATNLKKRLSRAEALYSEFHNSNGQIQMIEHESNNEIDVQDFDDHYFELIAKAEDILTLGSSNKPNTQSPSEEARHEANSQVRLPQITLPQFSGAFDEWVPFNETFNSLIHSNEGIGTVQKFHYLRSSLKGEAANCISELQITAKNYEIAWAALRERYDNRKLIIRKHIQAIHELPICKDENLSFLRQILDGVQKHTRSLKALDRPVEYWDDWLLYLICNKIDHVSNKEWESSIKGDKIPTFKELIEFLSHKCCTLESISQSALPSRIHQRNPQRVPLVHVTSQNTQCVICKSNHYIYNCPKFLQMSAEQRISQIKQTRCCFNCLNSGHVSSKCKGSSCKICHQRHNTLLHLSNSNSAISQISMSQGESSQVITTHASRVSHSQVVLSTAIVRVKDSSGTFHNCRALLDSGSQSNFISKALIQKLKLKTKSINLPVSGIGQSQTQINQVSEVIVRSNYNGFKMPLSCLILDNITNEIPIDPFNRSALNIRKNLKLADPEFHIPRKIDLLIGAEFFWQLLCVGQIKVENTGLIMQKTHLGWVISGPITCSKLMPRVTNCNVSSMQSLETAITKFWEIEEVSSKGAYSLDEAECENHFRNSYKGNHEGRFIVKLPVNADPNQALGESKQIAIRRLNSLENKLSKQPDLRDQYNSFMQEYIELGHMRQINDHEIQNHEYASFYLPHHAVVKGDSITTKLRVVFDGSAKSSSGHPLNDILMVGPSVQQDLFSITCRFRSHRIVLTADITKMYRQVLVAPSQTRLQRIVWRFNPSQNIETYELNTVTYGTASASFLATRALNQLAIEESNAFPLGAKISLRDFYVDDLLTGADSVQEIHQIFAEVTELLARGGRLRNAPAHFNKKFPIILPDKHVFTKLLIKQTHCEELHAGAQATLAKLRNKFWPISGRNLVRQVVRNCVTCFKVNPRAYQPIMGDLPKARLEPSRPFIRTGVDYCGPFLIRSHTRRKTSPSKAYVAIFICMATKAVHIELATSLNTDSFLNALKRFISRRGMVSQMYSDSGSNFVRANKELKELSTMFEGAAYNKIVDTLSNKGITWHFNPPRAPHFGGIWEAAVKSFKYHFKRIVGNVSLTIEEMNTVIAQIEACLNSRPLIPLSDDPDDLSVITPAHFLIGDSLTVNLEPNLLPLNINRLSRLQLLDRLKQHFWQRWSKEYLQQLQQRSKWTRSRGAAPQPGQLVIIKEDNLPPLLWSMGRVVSVHPGKDGITRAATIKTTRGEVKRPANKLCVLPCDNERN